MKRILLVAALVAALGLGSASFAQTYAGGGFGYTGMMGSLTVLGVPTSIGASGFSFFGQFGSVNAFGRDLGIRGRLGLVLGGVGVTGYPGEGFTSLTVEAAVTYNFGRVFGRGVPLTLYAVGGPQIGYNFGFATVPGFLVLGVGAGAGIQYAFSPTIAGFWEIHPLGFTVWFTPTTQFWYNLGSTLGLNFGF